MAQGMTIYVGGAHKVSMRLRVLNPENERREGSAGTSTAVPETSQLAEERLLSLHSRAIRAGGDEQHRVYERVRTSSEPQRSHSADEQ